jgi:signal peptidase
MLRVASRLGRFAIRVGAALVVVLVAAYVFLLVVGLQPMVMVTGSMTKTIPVGSLVVDQTVSPSSLRVGDVVSFRKPLGSPGLATHRIIEIQRSNGHVVYRTKGDSNPVADPWAIVFERNMQAHKVVFHAPYVGYALLFAHSRLGIILLIAYVCFSLLVTTLKVIAQTAVERRAGDEHAEGLEPSGSTV